LSIARIARAITQTSTRHNRTVTVDRLGCGPHGGVDIRSSRLPASALLKDGLMRIGKLSTGLATRLAVAGIALLIYPPPHSARAQDAAPTAPATSNGTIAGKIVDVSTGEPVIDAGVEVVGTGKQIRTDVDGRFSIPAPVGTYDVRVFASGFQGARIQGVTVQA